VARPGLTPLTRFQQQEIIKAAGAAMLESRDIIARRLQGGEPRASVESDLAPIVDRALVQLFNILDLLAPERALSGAASAVWATAYQVLRGDLEGLTMSQAEPAPDPDRAA
jgi:hypothetical protein